MQLLIKNSVPKKSEPRKRTEKKPKEVIKLFTVKVGLNEIKIFYDIYKIFFFRYEDYLIPVKKPI